MKTDGLEFGGTGMIKSLTSNSSITLITANSSNGASGNITLTTGNVTHDNDAAGTIAFNGGNATGNFGSGGDVNLTGGLGSANGTGGTLRLTAGGVNAISGGGGSIFIKPGEGGAGNLGGFTDLQDWAGNDSIVIRNDGINTLIGFYGNAAVAQQGIIGSKGGNVALANLITALSNLGLIWDSTT